MPGAHGGVSHVPGLAQCRDLCLGEAVRSRPARVTAWGAGRAGRYEAGRWRQAAAPEAGSTLIRTWCAAGLSGAAGGSRGGVAWADGAGRHDEARCQNPPNKGLQATAKSLRSFLATTLGGA